MLQHMGLGMLGTTCASWLPALAAEVAADPRRTRHCILLWGHRKNMLIPSLTRYGLASATSPSGKKYWTLLVGE